eukprot:Gb_13671 [translate_table: standard]
MFLHMNRVGKWFHLLQEIKPRNEINFFSSSGRGMEGVNSIHILQNDQHIMRFGLCKERNLLSCVSANQFQSDKGSMQVQEIGFLSNSIFKCFNLSQAFVSPKLLESSHVSKVRPFTQAVRKGHTLSREWLVQLWHIDKKRNRPKRKRQQAHVCSASPADSVPQTYYSSFRLPFDVPPIQVQPGPQAPSVGSEGPPLHQPAPTQSLGGILMPTCPEENCFAEGLIDIVTLRKA